MRELCKQCQGNPSRSLLLACEGAKDCQGSDLKLQEVSQARGAALFFSTQRSATPIYT